MSDALVIRAPRPADALFLLFHGVGATPASLRPLGERIAGAFPQAAVVAVPGPDASDLGAGLQWFSVRGVTEENRPQRVAATLPRFLATVRHWQQQLGLAPATTTLVGFSQGAILSLEAALAEPPPAARVVALGGRFAGRPQHAPAGARVHLLHGDADLVMPAAHAQQAARDLLALGADVTLDLVPGLGHGIDERMARLLLQRLQAA